MFDMNEPKSVKAIKSKTERQQRFEHLVTEFKHEGFTESQAVFLINLLDDFIPLI